MFVYVRIYFFFVRHAYVFGIRVRCEMISMINLVNTRHLTLLHVFFLWWKPPRSACPVTFKYVINDQLQSPWYMSPFWQLLGIISVVTSSMKADLLSQECTWMRKTFVYFLSDESVLWWGWGGRGAAGRRSACEVGPEGRVQVSSRGSHRTCNPTVKMSIWRPEVDYV